jgi:hypothetical protein
VNRYQPVQGARLTVPGYICRTNQKRGDKMNKLIGLLLLLGLPLVCAAEDYQSTLLVQTGTLLESDLIVRTVTDLESNKNCLAFYVRTTGTSPSMSCYDTKAGFRSKVSQTGHFKKGKLVVLRIEDSVNNVDCLVAYVSNEGTSPAINCYNSIPSARNEIVRSTHLREGDLEIERVLEANGNTTCLIAYVSVGSATPTLTCYASGAKGGGTGLSQQGYMREGDLVVRKIVDDSSNKECLISYVSTEGTSPFVYCFDKGGAIMPTSGEQSQPEPTTVTPGWKPKPFGQ